MYQLEATQQLHVGALLEGTHQQIQICSIAREDKVEMNEAEVIRLSELARKETEIVCNGFALVD